MILQWLKVSWMLTWRLMLLSAMFFMQVPAWIIIVSLGLAALLVFGFKSTIPTFPIIRLLFGRGAIRNRSNGPTGGNVITPESQQKIPSQNTSSNRGRMTGFEPKILEGISIPGNLSGMHGTPGKGLHSSGFGSTSISLGVKGEEIFAKALLKTGILQRTTSFWSVAMPSSSGVFPDSSRDTDIDCIISSGHKLYLIDLKYYTSGDVTYYSQGSNLYCKDNSTGQQVGKVRKMTRNMEMAEERFRNIFPGVSIESFVVIVPTDRGAANIAYNTHYPGSIPLVGMYEMIQYLNGNASSNSPNNVTKGIRKLVKR